LVGADFYRQVALIGRVNDERGDDGTRALFRSVRCCSGVLMYERRKSGGKMVHDGAPETVEGSTCFEWVERVGRHENGVWFQPLQEGSFIALSKRFIRFCWRESQVAIWLLALAAMVSCVGDYQRL
jgi:hypothetical protein